MENHGSGGNPLEDLAAEIKRLADETACLSRVARQIRNVGIGVHLEMTWDEVLTSSAKPSEISA